MPEASITCLKCMSCCLSQSPHQPSPYSLHPSIKKKKKNTKKMTQRPDKRGPQPLGCAFCHFHATRRLSSRSVYCAVQFSSRFILEGSLQTSAQSPGRRSKQSTLTFTPVAFLHASTNSFTDRPEQQNNRGLEKHMHLCHHVGHFALRKSSRKHDF